MKKLIWIHGAIAGLIAGGVLAYSTSMWYKTGSYEGSMLVGYASMLIAFSLIFVGIKTQRDKYNGGSISFGKAFTTGLWITLIASSIYVIVWLISYYCFIPDFMDKYIEQTLAKASAAGATDAEVASQKEQMAAYQKMYNNPLFVVLSTYAEIFPVGLIVSVISALILRRKKTS